MLCAKKIKMKKYEMWAWLNTNVTCLMTAEINKKRV